MVKQKEAESQYSDCLAARHRDGSEWKPTDTDKIHTPLQHLLQTNKPLDLSFSKGFPGGTTGKESICQCRRCKRQGFDPWVRKKPWGRKYHLLQYSSLGNPMNRGAWWAIVHGITESDVTEQRKKVSWGVNLNTLHRLMKSSQSAFLLRKAMKSLDNYRLLINMEVLREKRAVCYNKLNTFTHLSFSSVI